MTPQDITAHLISLADKDRAAHAQRYFKAEAGGYGEGDRFLGLRVPVVRLAVKHFSSASVDTAAQLLSAEWHEVRLFALLLLVAKFAKADEAGRTAIFHIYLAHTRHIDNWDLVDSSAPYIVGMHLRDKDRRILDELAQSKSLWERRIAIMATFAFIRDGEFDDALRLAERLLHDPEDLIHKACGWMLREIGKRDPAAETTFLQAHCRAMPRTMLRYAIEKFAPAERQRYLHGTA